MTLSLFLAMQSSSFSYMLAAFSLKSPINITLIQNNCCHLTPNSKQQFDLGNNLILVGLMASPAVQSSPIMDTHQSVQQGRSSGRWSKEEHQRFMYAIMQFGKDWKKVEQYVRTRTGSQVRSHAQKFFNKLLKAAPSDPNPRRQEHSETEMDFQREQISEVTPSTPLELVSLIKKQEKEEGGKINLLQLKKTLEEQGKEVLPKEAVLPQSSSFKSMSNILQAYQEVNSGKQSQHDESFFISITKKYKRLFKQVQDFDRLIDLHNASQHPKTEFSQQRKRSFTLPESSDVGEDQIEEKIEEIKRRINVEAREGRKQEKEEGGDGKRQRRDSESSIQFMPPPLGRLTTIQENPLQEQLLSFRAISQQKLEQQRQKAWQSRTKQ